SVVSDVLAVMRPQGKAVDELALRDLPDVSGSLIGVELAVLVAPLVLEEHEPGRPGSGRRGAGARDGVVKERELLAVAHRGCDSMHLFRIAETGRHEHAAVGQPVEKGRSPRLLVALEPRRQRGVTRRDAFEYQTAALLVRRP